MITTPTGATTPFYQSWNETADRFLSAGFQDPAGFADAVQSRDVTGDDMPGRLHCVLFKYILMFGSEGSGVTVPQLLEAGIEYADPNLKEDRLREIIYCEPSPANLLVYRQMVREHGQRFALYSAGRQAMQSAMNLTAPLNGQIVAARDRLTAITAAVAELELTPLSDLLAEPVEDESFLVNELLPIGGMSLLVAKPKVGKSTLARCLMFQVSRGADFLGRTCNQGAVVYLSFEDRRRDIAEHFRRLGAKDEPIHIYSGASLFNADGFGALARCIDRINPVLAVVDPLGKFAAMEDLSRYELMTPTTDRFLQIARQTGCHVLVLHHASKSAVRAATQCWAQPRSSVAWTRC